MDIIKLINFKEIFQFLVIQVIIKFAFIDFFSFLKDVFPIKYFILLLISSTFIAASGYLLASYLKSKKPNIYKNKTILLYVVLFSIIGLCGGIFATLQSTKINNIILPILSWVIVICLSIYINNRSFLKDLILSFFVASSALIVWWVYIPKDLSVLEWTLYYKIEMVVVMLAMKIFFGTLIKQTLYTFITKKSDTEKNKATLPVVFGIQKTKDLLILMAIISFFFSFFITIFIVKEITIFIVLILLMCIATLFIHKRMRNAKSEDDYMFVLNGVELSIFLMLIIITPLSALIINNQLRI